MKLYVRAVTVCALIFLTSCSPKSNSSGMAQPAKASREIIGVSLLTLDNPFFKIIGDNIANEAKKNGYDSVVVSADKDIAKQGNQVKDFIVKNVCAIVLSPCDPKSIVPIIQEANAAGIPVFTCLLYTSDAADE